MCLRNIANRAKRSYGTFLSGLAPVKKGGFIICIEEVTQIVRSGGGLCVGAKQEIFFRPIDKYRIITTGTEKYIKIRAVIYSVSFVPYNMRHGKRRRVYREAKRRLSMPERRRNCRFAVPR